MNQLLNSCYIRRPRARTTVVQTTSSTLQLKAVKASQNPPVKKPLLTHLKMQPFQYCLNSNVNVNDRLNFTEFLALFLAVTSHIIQ